jgi:hypothetical protein
MFFVGGENGEVTMERPQLYPLSISQRHACTDLLLLLLLVGELGWRRMGGEGGSGK